jgi:hypothetical protein
MERSARGKHAHLDCRARGCRALASPSGPRVCAVQRLSDAFYLRALRSSPFLRVK